MFAILIPVVLCFAVAGPNPNETDLGGTGISAPLYFKAGLAAFGTMKAVVSTGGRIAAKRSAGWMRQLRLTALSTRGHFRDKVATAYALALVTLAALYFSGVTLGAHLDAGTWVRMTGLILIGLVPFAALGIFLGHVLTAESTGPVIGASQRLSPCRAERGSRSRTVSCTTPPRRSRVLARAGEPRLARRTGWSGPGWFVPAAWTVALGALAARAYRGDTKRI